MHRETDADIADEGADTGYLRIVFSDAQSAVRRLSLVAGGRRTHEITGGLYRHTQSGGGLYARTQSDTGLYASTQTKNSHSTLPVGLRGPDASWDYYDE